MTYLVPSEKTEISVVVKSRGRHVNVDIRIQLCNVRAHCLHPVGETQGSG